MFFLITKRQAWPGGGGVVGYQYTPYFAPKIPIYLKIVKCVIIILFSRRIINVIILKQLVTSGDVNIGQC